MRSISEEMSLASPVQSKVPTDTCDMGPRRDEGEREGFYHLMPASRSPTLLKPIAPSHRWCPAQVRGFDEGIKVVGNRGSSQSRLVYRVLAKRDVTPKDFAKCGDGRQWMQEPVSVGRRLVESNITSPLSGFRVLLKDVGIRVLLLILPCPHFHEPYC